MLSWIQETGFQNTKFHYEYTIQKVKQYNQQLALHHGKLDLCIIDPCVPEQYRQGSQILVTNNWLAPGQLDPSRYQQFPNSWYGLYAGNVPIEVTKPTHRFNCFINRMDPIRQSWLYQLVRRGIFDQGLISFNMDVSRLPLSESRLPTDNPHEVFEKQFQHYLQIFSDEHHFVKSQVPFKNFDIDLDSAIMKTDFSIVLESCFCDNRLITFSEKIFRCLKLPRPWVLFAMKNSVAYLRDMKFDVLDDLVNHSYDSLDCEKERQSAILDQVEVLCQKTLSSLQIKRCEQAAIYNQNLLQEMNNKFYNDVDLTLQIAMNKCLLLT